jgi:uncharacterized protein YfeS
VLPTKPPSIVPGNIKLLPLLMATKTSKYRDVALAELERAVEEGKLLNWAHNKDDADYLGKIIWEVRARMTSPHLHVHAIH